MSSKKSSKSSKKNPSKATPQPTSNRMTWVVVGAIALAVIAVLVASNSAGKAKYQSPQGQTGSSSASIPAEEQKYLGRFLPAGYSAPSVADATTYSSVIRMTPVTAEKTAAGVAIKVSELTANKIVSFDAEKAGKPLSLIAFVRPSGKVFVGINYCPPCQGKGQRIEADGTLTCDTCGTKRDLETDAGISGACKLYPLDELPVSIQSDTLTIAQTAIDGWSEQPLDRKVGE